MGIAIYQYDFMKTVKSILQTSTLTSKWIFFRLYERYNGYRKFAILIIGTWSRKAAEEAKQYVQVNLVTPKTSKYTRVPPASEWNLSPDAAYFYYCDNETIHGVEFPEVPDVSSCPIVCDMSSNILTRPVDISKFGVKYAMFFCLPTIIYIYIYIQRRDAFPYPNWISFMSCKFFKSI